MSALRLSATVLSATLAVAQVSFAQSLPFSLFERYLDSLREQAGIPGLSAAIVQGQRVVWEHGFGVLDVDSTAPALPDTPYPVGDLTQTFAAVLLGQCVERGELDIDDPIRNWTNAVQEHSATVRHVLAHASDGSARAGFRSRDRIPLPEVVRSCLLQHRG